MRRFASASILLSALVASTTSSCVIVDPSCASGGASILVSPSTVVIAVGGSATPKTSWCHGGHYGPNNPQWSLSRPADASIVDLDPSTGRITGRRAGEATVIATANDADGGRISVTVR